MRAIVNIIAALSWGLAVLAGLATFLIMILISTDVVLRFLGSGVPGTLEIVTYYLMLIVAFISISRVELRDGMITVDALYSAVSRGAQRWIMAFATLASTVVYAGLTFASFQEAMKHFHVGSYAVTLSFVLLTWPAYFIVPLAFAAATLASGLRCIVAILGSRVPQDIGDRTGIVWISDAPEASTEIRKGSF